MQWAQSWDKPPPPPPPIKTRTSCLVCPTDCVVHIWESLKQICRNAKEKWQFMGSVCNCELTGGWDSQHRGRLGHWAGSGKNWNKERTELSVLTGGTTRDNHSVYPLSDTDSWPDLMKVIPDKIWLQSFSYLSYLLWVSVKIRLKVWGWLNLETEKSVLSSLLARRPPALTPPDWSSQFPRSLNVKLKVNKNNFDLLTDNVSCQLIQYKPPKCFGLDFKIKININSILYPDTTSTHILKLGWNQSLKTKFLYAHTPIMNGGEGGNYMKLGVEGVLKDEKKNSLLGFFWSKWRLTVSVSCGRV